MVNSSFAYIHCKPDSTPFYVGKGSLRRAKYLGERNNHHARTVNKYGRANILIGMMECSTHEIALSLEMGIIKCLRRMGTKLCNYTDGGEGTINPCPESRARMSEAAKVRGVSEATRAACKAAKKGVSLTEVHKDKLRRAQTGRVFTEEHRRNISIAAKKRGLTPQFRAAARVASKKRGKAKIEEVV